MNHMANKGPIAEIQYIFLKSLWTLLATIDYKNNLSCRLLP